MTPSRLMHDALARVVARDGSLYSSVPSVAEEAAAFMGWTRLARDAERILPDIERMAAEARAEGVRDVVVLGMGGSSLAAMVMGTLAGTGPARLRVPDTTSPVTVQRVLEETDPASTLYLYASKSGGTIEPAALYAVLRAHADERLGRAAAGRRFIALTDPGSPLERLAEDEGMRACISTPASVGGRYSALTAFGLLPAALAGVDVSALVRSALEVEDAFVNGSGDTGLAAAIAEACERGDDKLCVLAPPGLRVFGLWVEQLIAESLGKDGTGVVPWIDLRDAAIPDDEVRVTMSRDARSGEQTPPAWHARLASPADLGGWFVHWEYSTALAGAALGVNPFDQPNVAEAKDATSAVLAGAEPLLPDVAVDGVELTFGGSMEKPDHAERSIGAAVGHALDALRPGDYLAVLAYLPDDEDALEPLVRAAAALCSATGAATCLEIGPRYLHSTGQLHKGGPDSGLFLMITTADERDMDVPGRPWSLRELHVAQAEGDLVTLAAHGRRVLRVALRDARRETVADFADELLEAARSRTPPNDRGR